MSGSLEEVGDAVQSIAGFGMSQGRWWAGHGRVGTNGPMALLTRTQGNWFKANNATIIGDVTIGELCSFWFGAVVRGDVAPIVIGKRVNVQDCAVIHCDTDVPNVIGDDVTIGHGAIVHGTAVGSGSVIGMGA